jgi:hypothetical protein
MSEEREQDPTPKHQARPKHLPDWQPDLNPSRVAGPNVAEPSDARVEDEWTAFHLRKRGKDPGAVNHDELADGHREQAADAAPRLESGTKCPAIKADHSPGRSTVG